MGGRGRVKKRERTGERVKKRGGKRKREGGREGEKGEREKGWEGEKCIIATQQTIK